jgi:hypothetical protein
MTHERITRRELLLAAAGSVVAARARAADGFSFPLLGDLHFDRLEHHDMEWLTREKPGDVAQVKNYSRLTQEVLPRLLPEIRTTIAEAAGRVPFCLHVGDFVEGLCGTPELARRHCAEAVEFVREAKLGRPFLFTKGNHDVTGPGSVEAFDQVLLPFLSGESRQELRSASYAVTEGDSQFLFFDAYRPESLDWLEKTLERRAAKHVFVVIHPPVVPTGARSTWHVFAAERQRAQRQKLLTLLGRNRAIVLCGHLHKHGVLVRRTEAGPFAQVMVSSIMPNPMAEPAAVVTEYGPDLVQLEPRFSPETEAQRRENLRLEQPEIRRFEYAETPGYALLHVAARGVSAEFYSGLGRRRWKNVDVTKLMET